MGRLEERFINFVQNAIDLSIGNTGYPVLGKHLEYAGVATRKQLRQLVNKGLLKTIDVRDPKGTVYQAYYTNRVTPKWVEKQESASI